MAKEVIMAVVKAKGPQEPVVALRLKLGLLHMLERRPESHELGHRKRGEPGRDWRRSFQHRLNLPRAVGRRRVTEAMEVGKRQMYAPASIAVASSQAVVMAVAEFARAARCAMADGAQEIVDKAA